MLWNDIIRMQTKFLNQSELRCTSSMLLLQHFAGSINYVLTFVNLLFT
uniref:Uncharacterized protein n=1 Tax=Rhizophora mucronata TaxID=61149 RepID=A0A2P2P827_RHIMU